MHRTTVPTMVPTFPHPRLHSPTKDEDSRRRGPRHDRDDEDAEEEEEEQEQDDGSPIDVSPPPQSLQRPEGDESVMDPSWVPPGRAVFPRWGTDVAMDGRECLLLPGWGGEKKIIIRCQPSCGLIRCQPSCGLCERRPLPTCMGRPGDEDGPQSRHTDPLHQSLPLPSTA